MVPKVLLTLERNIPLRKNADGNGSTQPNALLLQIEIEIEMMTAELQNGEGFGDKMSSVSEVGKGNGCEGCQSNPIPGPAT